MANIDIGSLKKFQEQWEPVLAAIPAVISAVATQNDLQRGIAELQKQLDGIQAEIEQAKETAKKQIAKSKADADAAADKRRAVEAELEVAKAKFADEVAEAKAKAAAGMAEANNEVIVAQRAVKQYEKSNAERIAELEQEFADKKATLEGEIAAIETRRKEAERALDALRNKLG